MGKSLVPDLKTLPAQQDLGIRNHSSRVSRSFHRIFLNRTILKVNFYKTNKQEPVGFSLCGSNIVNIFYHQSIPE